NKGSWRFRRNNIEIIQYIFRIRNTAACQRGMFAVILKVFGKSQAKAMGTFAVYLAVDYDLIDNGSEIAEVSETDHTNLSSLYVYFHFRNKQLIHVVAEGSSLSCFQITVGAGAGYPGSLIESGNLFRYHLIIGAEGAVRFSHGVHQHFRRHSGGVSSHHIGTAAAGRTGRRCQSSIVHNQFDHLWCDARFLQRLMGHGQRTDVGALSVIFPGIKYG